MMIEFYSAELRAAKCQRSMCGDMFIPYMFRARVAQDAGHSAPADRYSQKIMELGADIGEAERVLTVLKKLKIGGQDN